MFFWCIDLCEAIFRPNADYNKNLYFTFVLLISFSNRGLPFIAHLDSLPNFTRSSDGPVRLPIVDKYKVSNWKLLVLISCKKKTKTIGSLCSAQLRSQRMSGCKISFGSCSLCQNPFSLSCQFVILLPLEFFSQNTQTVTQ